MVVIEWVKSSQSIHPVTIIREVICTSVWYEFQTFTKKYPESTTSYLGHIVENNIATHSSVNYVKSTYICGSVVAGGAADAPIAGTVSAVVIAAKAAVSSFFDFVITYSSYNLLK